MNVAARVARKAKHVSSGGQWNFLREGTEIIEFLRALFVNPVPKRI